MIITGVGKHLNLADRTFNVVCALFLLFTALCTANNTQVGASATVWYSH